MGQVDRVAELIAAANQRLVASNISVRIQERGKARRLCLRATFPAKPGSEGVGAHQQRLNLGTNATADAIQQAEDQAKIIGGQLNLGTFAWTDWIDVVTPGNTCLDWVQVLETHYWRNDVDRADPRKLETWRVAYHSVLQSLPFEEEMTPALLEKWIEEKSPATRRREHFVTAANKLCGHAGIKHDFSWLLEGIGTAPINPRSLPSDEQLIEIYRSVSGSHYQWVVGMMIAYGLRNHELFGLDMTDFPEITTAKTSKTGSRIVIPFMPGGLKPEDWDLQQLWWPKNWPQYSPTMSNSHMGKYVTLLFRRRFKGQATAYDCRHCFARRLKDNSLDSWDSAKLMGHSERIHAKRYQAWFGQRYHIDRIKQKVGRE
jgi:integrase